MNSRNQCQESRYQYREVGNLHNNGRNGGTNTGSVRTPGTIPDIE